MEIIINGIYNIEDGIAVRLTDDKGSLRTIRMEEKAYHQDFPKGLSEGDILDAQVDFFGRITYLYPRKTVRVEEMNPSAWEPDKEEPKQTKRPKDEVGEDFWDLGDVGWQPPLND